MRIVILSAVLFIAGGNQVRTGSPESGFVPLFNGSDLSGWVNVNCAPSTFTVRDGMIICSGTPTGVLRTKRMYENYILEMDWIHLYKGGNSGLFLHSGPITVRGQPFTKAFEVRVMDGDDPSGLWTGHGDVFAIHGSSFVPDRPHPKGWMRCLPSEKRANPYGHWNHYRLEVRDGRISLAVNGKVVSGGSKCNPRKGYVCLESEGSEAHFRNLRIKVLPSSNPPQSEVAEVDEGFVSLYNGLDLTGWKSDSTVREQWRPKDWILECGGESNVPRKDLWTKREFRNFILIVDWRVTKPSTYLIIPNVILRGYSSLRSNDPSAAKPVGEWNRYVITLRGNSVTVRLNDKTVVDNESIPNMPDHGDIGLSIGEKALSYPVQFANLYVKELSRVAIQSWPPIATFSILGYDPATGEVGGAVQSRVFSVGNGVLWAEAGVGAAATQAIVDVSYGPQALALLRKGMKPKDIVKKIWNDDPDPRPQDWTKQGRQFAVINTKGDVAAFTGPKASVWAGDRQGKFCTAQGNILAGPEVVGKMVEAFESTNGDLSFRLLAALEAGQKAGGDKRGMQSAAMLIVKKDGGVWLHNDVVLRLQVDDNAEPIKELRRLVEKAAAQRDRSRR